MPYLTAVIYHQLKRLSALNCVVCIRFVLGSLEVTFQLFFSFSVEDPLGSVSYSNRNARIYCPA